MKKPTVRWIEGSKCLHIEANGCIINIRDQLHDHSGREVTSIEIIPDKFAGEPKWRLYGTPNNRVVKEQPSSKIKD